MNGFKEAFRRSTVIQGLITFMLLGVICYLVVVDRVVPELLGSFGTLIVGFWLGSKSTQ